MLRVARGMCVFCGAGMQKLARVTGGEVWGGNARPGADL